MNAFKQFKTACSKFNILGKIVFFIPLCFFYGLEALLDLIFVKKEHR